MHASARRLALLLIAALPAAALAQQMMGGGGHGMHQGGMHGGGMMHDEVNMPMLNGRDTTETEVDELRQMFQNHPDLTRSVENLPDGIRTVTETDNPDLRAALVGHVTGMLARIDEKRDPGIPIQSPTLDILFARSEAITTEIEPTERGIAVIQTSTDPELVAALQTHAAEVSDMAERGMQAVHERMMGQMHN